MARTKKQPAAPALPASHLELLDKCGFEVIRWQNVSIPAICSDGRERNEWLPKTFVNWEKKQICEWMEAGQGNYRFAGWESSVGHSCGGRYDTVAGAIGWFSWLEQNNKRFNY